jgi:deferrochelatase/peroxidase EfeB
MRSTRRDFLVGAGGAGLGVAVGVGADRAIAGTGVVGRSDEAVPFFGEHQAGITTPTQEHLQFGSFDVASESIADLRDLLRRWSAAAELIARGLPVGAVATGDGVAVDTGEALGLRPSRVTVTFGLGPGVFGSGGADRFGLAGLRPGPLVDVPAFSSDALQPRICGGDLGVQVCADDPQVAFHALHDLIRLASPTAVPRWVLAGFGATANSTSQRTPRNLMGFKDGTANLMAEDTPALRRFVWASAAESPVWMRGGSYMVIRRIKMMLGAWDASSFNDQEATFGRHKVSGAPLGAVREHDPLDLSARAGGLPVIPADAHVRLASPAYNGGQRILRRGYSFVDGVDESTGSAAGGLLFICFQRDPRTQFIPIQRRLAASDALNRHIEHVGSAIFACPPAARPGGFVGERLFA